MLLDSNVKDSTYMHSDTFFFGFTSYVSPLSNSLYVPSREQLEHEERAIVFDAAVPARAPDVSAADTGPRRVRTREVQVLLCDSLGFEPQIGLQVGC